MKLFVCTKIFVQFNHFNVLQNVYGHNEHRKLKSIHDNQDLNNYLIQF
jgi:hypothetical protein